jgi:hypothetical protein
MFTTPTLPVNMVWHCPIGGGTCSYIVDMCSLSQDHLRLVHGRVPKGNIESLLNKEWKCDDEQMMMVFYEIVNSHWEDHLRELDIEFVRSDGVVSHYIQPKLTWLSACLEQGTFVEMHPGQLPSRTGKWQQWRSRIQRY